MDKLQKIKLCWRYIISWSYFWRAHLFQHKVWRSSPQGGKQFCFSGLVELNKYIPKKSGVMIILTNVYRIVLSYNPVHGLIQTSFLGPYNWITDSDPDPNLLFGNFQDALKENNFTYMKWELELCGPTAGMSDWLNCWLYPTPPPPTQRGLNTKRP